MLIEVLTKDIQDMTVLETISKLFKTIEEIYEMMSTMDFGIPLIEKIITMLSELYDLKPFSGDFKILSMILGKFMSASSFFFLFLQKILHTDSVK